jgi:hypothetical protein
LTTHLRRPTVYSSANPLEELAPSRLPPHLPLRQSLPAISDWSIVRVSGSLPKSHAPSRYSILSSFPVHCRLRSQLRALTWSTLLTSALACGSDRPAGPASSETGDDSLPSPPDSVAAPDSLPPPDSVIGPNPVDPVPTDPIPPTDSVAPTRPAYTGTPFGMFRLWQDSTTLAWGPEPFTLTFNSINAVAIVDHINAARRANVQLMLAMSTGHRFITDGKFDMAKWKARINTFDQPEIRAAVAAGLADGTILGNAVVDEPNTKKWGGVIDKAMVDEMCAYVRNIFPGLPQGVPVVHWWRPDERYKICDFIIDQWNWWQGPHGPGEGSYTGNLAAWRDAGLAQAKKDGIAIAFSMNVIDGGIQSWATMECPIPRTGGRGTSPPRCQMTAEQVRDWGLTLGVEGCAMFLWWYRPDFMSKPANVQAIKDIAAKLATVPRRSCRRPN